MIDPVSLQMVRDIVAIFGVIAGFTYYVMVVRNSQKNQQMQLETRQAQLFMQIYQGMSSPEHFRMANELSKMEWDDYDDFYRKYSGEHNPEAFAMRYSTWYRYNGIGLLVKAGLIDVNRVYDLLNEMILWQWVKWEDIIVRSRDLYNLPGYMEGFEFIANEMKKTRENRGFSADVPEGFGIYVPKKLEG